MAPEYDYVFRVYWDEEYKGFMANYFEPVECEVIGNIYENPELLEKHSKPEAVLWFNDRIALENAFKKWAKEHDVKDCLNSFIVFLISHDLIDEKKTIEYLRLVGDKK